MNRLSGAIVALSVAFAATAAQAQDGGAFFSMNPYIEGGLGLSNTTFESGGFNTVGTFANVVESDEKASVSVKLAAGVTDVVTFGPVGLRVEGELRIIPSESTVTGSFPGAPAPTFFYTTQIKTTYVGMANLWADYRPFNSMPLTLSIGGGIGMARLSASTTDGVVTGNGNDTVFAWNVGAQAAYAFDENFSLGLEARYYDLGKLDLPLNSGAGGNYTIDVSSIYAGVFLRLNFGSIGG